MLGNSGLYCVSAVLNGLSVDRFACEAVNERYGVLVDCVNSSYCEVRLYICEVCIPLYEGIALVYGSLGCYCILARNNNLRVYRFACETVHKCYRMLLNRFRRRRLCRCRL